MSLKKVQLPGTYLLALSECMTDFGIDHSRWLAGCELPTIDSGILHESIDFNVFKELLVRAVKLSNNPALGISLGQRLSLPSHGVLGYALMNSMNLFSAVKLLEQYITIRMPLLEVRTFNQGNDFVLQFDEREPLEGLKIVIFDALLVTIKSALDQLLPNLKADVTFCFPLPMHKNTPYGNLSESTLLFNQSTASIRINKDIINEPIPFANLAAYMEAEALCRKELKALSHESTYKSSIKKKLIEDTEQFPTQKVMASWFNLTSRTLHRRLVLEGTSYRSILEEVKKSLAASYLSNSNLTIKEISYFLGYEEDRNFRRAFKRWYAVSPSSFRESNSSLNIIDK